MLPAILLLIAPTISAEPPTQKNLEYARAGDTPLLLDLYIPATDKPAPLVLWIHGGAWRSGSKNSPSILPLTQKGFALASIEYRLSPVAKFPAQIHDIKAAIRYLRGTAGQHKIDATKIAITGGSAGGHLASLVGVTNGHKVLEGDLGSHKDQSSDVQAIVSFYGASNLTTILAQSTPHGLNVRVPALELLIGGQPDAKPDLARLASPVFHTDKSDPPLLWFHGDQDPQMPINQAHEMIGAYKTHQLPAQLEVIHGAAHGGKQFFTDQQLTQVAEFLTNTIKQSK